jgi:predicted transcriptional regulator
MFTRYPDKVDLMTRGRDRSVSDVRLLLEIILQRDRPLFSSDLESLPLTKERCRQILRDLDDEGLVTVEVVNGSNLYYITDDGFEVVAEELRARLDEPN